MTRPSAPDAVGAAGPDAPTSSIEPGRRRHERLSALTDGFSFVFAGLAAVWLTWLVVSDSVRIGWAGVLYLLVAWGLLAYLALPRLHRILTAVYVPDYFIGRARTANGLLGDPVNVALLGDEYQLDAAMTAAGWTRADPVTVASSLKIVRATLGRRSYDQAPVSPLFLFGRQQDVAYQQEVEGNPSRRHHVRFWRCPPGWPLPGGHRVDWVAAGTFDRAVGLSLLTLQVTHKIAPDIDAERDHVVATLVAAEPAVEVELIRDFSTAYHARNGGGDQMVTDGDLPIVDLRAVSVPTTPEEAPAPEADAGARPGPDDEPSPPAARAVRRPTATTLGALLVALGVLADVQWLVALARHWDEVVRPVVAGVGADPGQVQDSGPAFTAVLVLFAAVAAVQLVLAWGVFRGVPWARGVVMLLATVSTTSSFVGWAVSGQQITLRTTLVTVALDILVLLTLSSSDARAYARRGRTARPRRRGSSR